MARVGHSNQCSGHRSQRFNPPSYPAWGALFTVAKVLRRPHLTHFCSPLLRFGCQSGHTSCCPDAPNPKRTGSCRLQTAAEPRTAEQPRPSIAQEVLLQASKTQFSRPIRRPHAHLCPVPRPRPCVPAALAHAAVAAHALRCRGHRRAVPAAHGPVGLRRSTMCSPTRAWPGRRWRPGHPTRAWPGRRWRPGHPTRAWPGRGWRPAPTSHSPMRVFPMGCLAFGNSD